MLLREEWLLETGSGQHWIYHKDRKPSNARISPVPPSKPAPSSRVSPTHSFLKELPWPFRNVLCCQKDARSSFTEMNLGRIPAVCTV